MKKIIVMMIQFRLNLLLNVFFVLQCILAFLLINSTVSELFYDEYVGKYGTFDENSTIFLSGAVEGNVGYGDARSFFELVENVRETEGVRGVGYQLNENFVGGKNGDLVMDAYVLKEEMLSVRYPMSQGEWFPEKEKGDGVIRVILGGDVARQYGLRERITLEKLEVIDGVLQTVPVQAEVIGKLKSPTFLFDLDVASTHPQYGNLFMRMDNVILTDDDSIVSQGDVRYPLTSLLVFAEEGADLTALKRKLADYGVPFDFQEIDDVYRATVKRRLANKLPATGIVTLAILFGIVGITYLNVYQNVKAMSTCYLCGLSRRGCVMVLTGMNLFMMLLALFFAVLLWRHPYVKGYLFQRSIMGKWNAVVTAGFLALATATTVLTCRQYFRQSPVTLLRRFE